MALFLEQYASVIGTLIETQTTVTRVSTFGSGYEVTTNKGLWRCRALVLANGANSDACIPGYTDQIDPSICQISAKQYKNPTQLPKGGVLVVGASATGVQFAREIHCRQRPVTLSVGEHVRMPRTYRGKDILWWMNAAGIFDESIDDMDDINRARIIPSPQLSGDSQSAIDLNSLTEIGVELVGRLSGVNQQNLQFSGSLANNCALADLKMYRLLSRIDQWVSQSRINACDASPIVSTQVPESPKLVLPLDRGEVNTIIWATGFKPDFSWLEVPVFNRKGRINHSGGILPAPGLVMLGHSFMRKRKSSFIFGIKDDVNEVCSYISDHLSVSNDLHQEAPPSSADCKEVRLGPLD